MTMHLQHRRGQPPARCWRCQPTPWPAWLVVLALLVPVAQAAEIWRWQDAEGGTHFGDGPPPPDAVNPQRMAGAAPVDPAQRAAAAAREQRLQRNQALERVARERRRETAAVEAERVAGVQRDQAWRCRKAQHNVAVYTSGAPVYLTAPDGTRTYLDDEQRAQALAFARQEVGLSCAP